eukprot:2998627-Rhodomonas_salina.2
MLEAAAKMRENAAPAMRMEAALERSQTCRWMWGIEAAVCHGTKGMTLHAQAERGTLPRQFPFSFQAKGWPENRAVITWAHSWAKVASTTHTLKVIENMTPEAHCSYASTLPEAKAHANNRIVTQIGNQAEDPGVAEAKWRQ